MQKFQKKLKFQHWFILFIFTFFYIFNSSQVFAMSLSEQLQKEALQNLQENMDRNREYLLANEKKIERGNEVRVRYNEWRDSLDPLTLAYLECEEDVPCERSLLMGNLLQEVEENKGLIAGELGVLIVVLISYALWRRRNKASI